MATNRAKTALLCAYTLAKAGRYSEAEAYLLSQPEIAKTPVALDLLARLRVEQHDTIEARRLWEELSHTHPSYLPARAALKNLNKRPAFFTRARLCFLAIIVGIAGAFALGLMMAPFLGTSVPPPPSTMVYQWETLPRLYDLQPLTVHRGKVKRISVASHLFAEPKAFARRQNLIEALQALLALEGHQLFFGEAHPEAGPEAVQIEIEASSPSATR